MSAQDERRVVAKAHAILSTLAPGTKGNSDVAAALRDATRHITTAMARASSGDVALNTMRGDAANALSAVTGSLDGRTLTQETIDVAERAVAKLQDGIRQGSAEPEKIYVDPTLPATLQHDGEFLECHSLEEAVLAWLRLPEEERKEATIKMNVAGGAIYTAAEIERLHIGAEHLRE
jgi:hypothetical protein